MSDNLALDRANLVSLWLESLLYGVFLVFHIHAIYVLLYKKLHGKTNRPMVVASFLMLILITGHMACDLYRAIQAFTTGQNTVEYYGNIAESAEWAKTIIYYLLNVIGDTIVLYRCYVVWGGARGIMVLPFLLYLADISVGAQSCNALLSIKPGQLIFVDTLAKWALTFFSLTLTLNAVCTLLISYRIWSTSRAVAHTRSGRGRSLWRVIEILVESAAVYSCSLLAMIGTYVANSNAQYITLDALPPIVGIVFELIIVRVGLGIASGDGGQSTIATGNSGTGVQVMGPGSFALQPLAFNSRRTAEVSITQNSIQDSAYSDGSKHDRVASSLDPSKSYNMSV